MKIFRSGLAEHAWDELKESLSRFQAVESRLDELRSYLYANRESIRGYAAGFRNRERVSTAHVESTVNQLINSAFTQTPVPPAFYRLANVQETTNEPEPRRSAISALRENRDPQPSSRTIYGTPSI
jgi:hypothetical protein